MFRKDLILRYGYLASLSLIPLSVIAQHEQRKNVCVCVCVYMYKSDCLFAPLLIGVACIGNSIDNECRFRQDSYRACNGSEESQCPVAASRKNAVDTASKNRLHGL